MRLYLITKAIARNVLEGMHYLFPRNARFKPVVECYPDKVSGRTPEDMFPRMRGFLRNDLSKCTGCGECIDLCSVKALNMETAIKPDGSVQVQSFKIDLGRCYGCSICVDICPVGSIQHTQEYEGASLTKDGLILEFAQEGTKEKIPTQRMRTYEFRWK